MPTIDIAQTGANIRRLQKQHHTTGKMLADICGVTPAAVSKWGKNCIPTIDVLVVMAHCWGIAVDDIIAVAIN